MPSDAVNAYIWWSGFVVNAIGALIVTGFLVRIAIDRWLEVSTLKQAILGWFWADLKRKAAERREGRHGAE